jgi:hypothetical protein
MVSWYHTVPVRQVSGYKARSVLTLVLRSLHSAHALLGFPQYTMSKRAELNSNESRIEVRQAIIDQRAQSSRSEGLVAVRFTCSHMRINEEEVYQRGSELAKG